jgi:protein gp37
MGVETGISWCHHTWNPWRGCAKVSDGCLHCYAEATSARNPKSLGEWGPTARRSIAAPGYWKLPHRWDADADVLGERRRVFMLSLGDFMELRPDLDGPRERAWETVRATRSLDYLILTKRIENWRECWPIGATGNVWLGVSVEDRRHGVPRIDLLREVPAVVRFLSVEPLLEDLGEIDLAGIHWVVVGGESGPHYRPMALDWARSIRDTCRAAGVPFFFKQSSGLRPGKGDTLDGVAYKEFPR